MKVFVNDMFMVWISQDLLVCECIVAFKRIIMGGGGAQDVVWMTEQPWDLRARDDESGVAGERRDNV